MKEPDWENIRGVYAVSNGSSAWASIGDRFLIAGYLDDEYSGDRLLVLHKGEGAELFTAHWSHFRIMKGVSDGYERRDPRPS